MQDSSLSKSPQVSPAPREASAVSAHGVRAGGQKLWKSFWKTQRLYWRLTLLMFVVVTAILGVAALILLGVISRSISPSAAAQLQWPIIGGALGLALLITSAIVVALQISGRQTHRVTAVVRRLTSGELDARADMSMGGEVGRLSRAVNQLAERTERQASARQRERDRLDTVLQTMSDGVIMLDRRGYVTMMNPAASRLLRAPAETALHQSFVQVVRDYRLADVWQECVQAKKEQSATIELGSSAFIRINVTPFLNGASNGFLVLLQDLSHLHRLEVVRRDFVSNISHELRTPLASIKALVDTLRDGAISDPPAAEHFLERMEIEVDSMTQMVQELLELSRIESGQAPLRLFPTALDTLIEPAVERLRAQADRANVTLAVVLPEQLPQVMVDADRIRQVIINLVHNAIKFTPTGGYVTVTVRAVPDGAVVSVADTGIGIPAEDLPRIFERFYKADRARSSGGTGLGLAIAKHTVQAHSGKIWVESVEGKGSTFSFILPPVNPPLTQL